MAAFLDQAKHRGAGTSFRRGLETVMKEKGPAALLPLEGMRRANQETWIALYPQYRDRAQRPSRRQRLGRARAP